MESQIRAAMVGFIVDNFLFGDTDRLPGDSTSLIDSGVVDSTGVLELIEFLESRFEVLVEESETVPANLGSIDGLVSFVARKGPALQPAV